MKLRHLKKALAIWKISVRTMAYARVFTYWDKLRWFSKLVFQHTLCDVPSEIKRWFYSLWAHVRNPRQIISGVPNVSVIKCIFVEEKIWKWWYIRFYHFACARRIPLDWEMDGGSETAFGCWLCLRLLHSLWLKSCLGVWLSFAWHGFKRTFYKFISIITHMQANALMKIIKKWTPCLGWWDCRPAPCSGEQSGRR